jgi:N-carbamoyl-L-amino-acid hydrolase
LEIDAARLQENMEEMARIGATPGGGVHRLTLTDEDREARDLFKGWAGEAGLAVSVDEMGNMFARREGSENSAPPVMAGSHLDSVPNGGRFDGALGVLGALEAVRSLNDQNISTRRPIEIVNWTNEEGPRFPPSMLGSGVFAGAFERDFAYAVQDAGGKRFVDELDRIGYRGEVPCRPRPLAAYLELHVEQGPALIAGGAQIGIVEGIQGLTWMRAKMAGERDHAGPTPMDTRRDALVGAARAIVAIRGIAGEIAGLVATVGEMSVSPGAINVIPGLAEFSVDIRHREAGTLKRAEEAARAALREAAEGEHLELEIIPLGGCTPIAFDPGVTGAIERGGPRRALRGRPVPLGHDLRAQPGGQKPRRG